MINILEKHTDVDNRCMHDKVDAKFHRDWLTHSGGGRVLICIYDVIIIVRCSCFCTWFTTDCPMTASHTASDRHVAVNCFLSGHTYTLMKKNHMAVNSCTQWSNTLY